MPSWWQGKPLLVATGILLVIVFSRAQATYWLGRAARKGALRSTAAGWMDGPKMRAAVTKLDRWGWPLIPVSFLTIGFQTLVNAAAGLIGMSPWRYTLAMLPGCLAWALIYATVGMTVVLGWISLAAQSAWAPWVMAAVLVLVAVCVIVFRWRRQRMRVQ